MHVHGDGQLNLPEVLASAGIEVDLEPSVLWLSYALWQARVASPWGQREPNTTRRARALKLEDALRESAASASLALAVGGVALCSIDELAAHAAPFLPSTLRGGYGHVEIGLAVRAALQRRGHFIVSVKSFGCIPSAGVADAIIPTALNGALPFLSLEVCGSGSSVTESRLAMFAAAAHDRAAQEMADAGRARGGVTDPISQWASDPIEGRHEIGQRAYACTLACDLTGIIEEDGSCSVAHG